jgi:small ligand-binding sensory domain FIST
MMPLPVATALASADKPSAELVADVVTTALDHAGIDIPGSVLLFLSGEFARIAPQAVAAASRAAQCLQIAGCTASGVFTEADWVMDRPAACTMVFGGGVSLSTALGASSPCLSLAVPQTATTDWIGNGARRFGLISTGAAGHEPGRVWGHGKVLAEHRYEASLHGARAAIGVSRGLRVLGAPMEVSEADGYDVRRIAGLPALDTLLRELPLDLRGMERLPFHLLSAAVIDGDPADAVKSGCFKLVPIIAASTDDRCITLAAPLARGTRLFWCARQALAAERDTRGALDNAADILAATPDFAIVFSCMGRGPYFFGGRDRDLDLIRERFPCLPIIGAYGAGEIAPLPSGNGLIHNSAVIALCAADV